MNESQERSSIFPALRSRSLIFTLAAAVLMILLALPRLNVAAQDATATAEATEMSASTAAIVTAANTFLGSLDDTQQAAVLFDFNDTAQRENWSNFPTGIFNRAGVSYSSMTDEQRTNVMSLLKVALSEEGYQKLIDEMTADEILGQSQNNQSMFGYGLYFVSILGTPSETDPWILQWGGHHFALNITFTGNDEILTPSHTGCQPCVYTINDQEVNVLGDEYSKALTLVNALDADQQATAVLDYSVTNLVLGPGEEDRALEPEGLPGSSMTADQQAMLLDVIGEWVNIAPAAAAATRMAEIESTINDTYFAWSGDTSADSASSYFRVTGPTLLIEFSPQGNGGGGAGGGTRPTGGGAPPGGNNAQSTGEASATSYANTFALNLGSYTITQDASHLYHVHTIYRDPTNAYGAAVTGQ
jgi:hypothetical protein